MVFMDFSSIFSNSPQMIEEIITKDNNSDKSIWTKPMSALNTPVLEHTELENTLCALKKILNRRSSGIAAKCNGRTVFVFCFVAYSINGRNNDENNLWQS